MPETSTLATNPLNDDFAKLAKLAMERFHVPGISVAVVTKDNVFSEGYGCAALPDKPVTPETLFYCGSTTKSFTTASLALLMEEHKGISWNTPISSIIRDDFVLQDEYMTNHITLEDAACHRTSIPRHEECYGAVDQSLGDVVRRLRHMPLMEAPFRTKFEYSNIPWIALSMVVEKLSGMSVEDYFRKNIWAPLGMDSTYFGHGKMEEEAKKGVNLARGYYWREENEMFIEEEFMDLSQIVSGAGANVSTVLDYAKYLQMMMKKSGPLSEAAHTELRKVRAFTGDTDYPSVFAGPEAYTLGWFVQVYRGVEIIHHAGGLLGFSSVMLYIPSLSVGVVLLSNASQYAWFAIEAMLFSLVDDALKSPTEDRFDFIAQSTEKVAKGKKEQEETRSKLYGAFPEHMRKGMPLEFYEGTYTHPGYQTYTFKVAKQNAIVPQGDPEKQVLRAEDGFGKMWPHAIELEHVNGPFFIAWVLSPKDGGKFETLRRGVKAEFRIEPEGKVSKLGIAMEPAAGEQKIWFEREG